MNDIAAFLRARLDEEEQAARAVADDLAWSVPDHSSARPAVRRPPGLPRRVAAVRERYTPGSRFRSVFGGVFTITGDWHYHPEQEAIIQADKKGLLFYTVTYEDGHEAILEHGVIDSTCTPLNNESEHS